MATLTWIVPSVRALLCTPQHRFIGEGSVPRARMSCARDQDHESAVDPEEIWAHLKGKKTCANEAAGKVQ